MLSPGTHLGGAQRFSVAEIIAENENDYILRTST